MQNAGRYRCGSHHGSIGFTLIDCLIAISLLAILTSVAIPSFASITRQFRLDAVTEEFMASVQFARVEARRLGRDMVIRPQTGCEVVLISTADWSCGWEVFVDINGNKALDGGEPVLQSVAVPPNITFLKSSGGSLRYLQINRFGEAASKAHRFDVFQKLQTVADGQVICFSTGTRLRTVKRVKVCPPLPGESA